MNRVIAALLLIFALVSPSLASAQTTLETFETATHGATSFTSAGVTFDLVSVVGGFRIQANYPGTGWSGTVNDDRYIDNSGATSGAGYAQFSVKTRNGSSFAVKRFWLFLSAANLNQNVSGSVTVSGKLAGTTVFTSTKTSGFATGLGSTNGYSLIDLSDFVGNNYSNTAIDAIEITTGGAYAYVGLDALTWATATQTQFSIGGVVNGLAAGSSITLANGAESVTVNASGAFTFPTQLASGAPYSVTITTQPATPPQFCSVTNGAGVVGTANVTNIVVNCASNLQLQLTDDDNYIGYGESRDYVVALINTTLVDVSSVNVAATLSEAFDLSASSWKCLSSGESGVVCNGSLTQGALADTASVVSGAAVQWLVRTKTKATTSANTADLGVTASFASPKTDSNILVLFRNDFEANGIAGIALPSVQSASILDAEESYTFDPVSASADLIDTALTLSTDTGVVRVQRLNANSAPWLRLQWLEDGKTAASDWLRATPDMPLTIGSMDVDGNRIILLDGAGVSAQLPLIKQ